MRLFGFVAAGQPTIRWPQGPTLTTYTSPLPPTHGVSGRSTSIPVMWTVKPASAHNPPVLYIYLLMSPIKSVHSEPLSVTVPVVIGTCVGWYSRVCTCTATSIYFRALYCIVPYALWDRWEEYRYWYTSSSKSRDLLVRGMFILASLKETSCLK